MQTQTTTKIILSKEELQAIDKTYDILSFICENLPQECSKCKYSNEETNICKLGEVQAFLVEILHNNPLIF